MKTMEDQRRSALSHRTASNALQKSTSSKTMGVHGYYVAKVGIPKREPHYTIPRDENSNFFKHVTRSTKGIPGPNAYDKSLSWKTNNGQFGCGPARKTFTDDAAKLSKQVPSAAHYKPDYQRKLLLGHMSKTEGVDYLSDH